MSLQWLLSRDVPSDTAQIGQAILRPDNVYRQIGDRFNELLPQESEFADLYEQTGRGAIPPLLLALVTVFQMLEKVPDRLAAELVISRIDWKYALHLPLSYAGFHFCDLSAFRQRLLDHKQERRVFEELLVRLRELGLIKPHGKGRTDSTHILGVVERLSQLELVSESIRLALGAMVRVAPEWAEKTLPAVFIESYEQRQSQYGLSQTQVQAKLVAAGRDGFWLMEQVEQSGPEVVRELGQVGSLRNVLDQQFTVGLDGPPAEKRPMGRVVIESPHEPEVRRAVKRGKFWEGYKAQVTESCDESKPKLIIDLEATDALAPDVPELGNIQARLEADGIRLGEQYVDQGYTSGRNIAQSQKAGIELVGIPPQDTQGPDGFRQRDFKIDEEAKQAMCPTGEVSVEWSERSSAEEGEPGGVQVYFERETCRACEYFGRCTKSSQGRRLELHPYRKVLEERRIEAKGEEYKQKLKVRAGIEGTISELVRGHGMRFARYRGLGKLRLQCLFTAVAVNLKRLVGWWAKHMAETAEMRGSVRTRAQGLAAKGRASAILAAKDLIGAGLPA